MGVPTKGVSLSTIVVQTLSGLVKGMERENIIPQVISVEEAVDILNKVESISLPSGSPPRAEDFLSEHDIPPAEPFIAKDLKGSIDAILNQTPSAGIVPKVTTPTVQELDRPEVIAPLKDQPRLDFDYIEKEADPDDILVTSVKGNTVGEMALGVVYENLARSMWGTDTAKQLVVQLIEGENKI
jgi:hypothetical protein